MIVVQLRQLYNTFLQWALNRTIEHMTSSMSIAETNYNSSYCVKVGNSARGVARIF